MLNHSSSAVVIALNPTPPRTHSGFAHSRQRSASDILASFKLPAPPNGKSRYYTTCPQCSAYRSTAAHRNAKVLGVTIDNEGVHFGCNHCGWTGGGFYESPGRQEQQHPFAKIYDYIDESGTLLFQVCRKADKTFPQRRPDGNGGWIWNLDDTRRVLYRLPELIEAVANDRVVFIVEGEKDANRLASLNIPATTNPGGASDEGEKSKWWDEYNEHLRGANICIVPDNDSPGRAHAQAVAQSLFGIASRIRVFDPTKHWAACPKSGDISDWLDAGNSVERLWQIVESLPDWTAKPANSPNEEVSLPWINMSNWDNEPIPERKWAIRERVPLHQVGLFSGEGGAGKSIIELMKNTAHATAKDWCGSLPEPGPAFYIGAEDTVDELHIRLAAIASHYGVTFNDLITGQLHVLCLLGKDATLCAVNGKSGKVETTALYQQLYEAAGDIKPKNISIDPLSRAFAGSELDRVQVYAFAGHMQALAMVANGSVTVLSHPSLAGIATRFRQYLIGVKPKDGEQPEGDLRELQFKKNQYGPIGETIVLRYQHGLFLPERALSNIEMAAKERSLQDLLIATGKKLELRGEELSPSETSHRYAPTVIAKEAEAKGVKKSDLVAVFKRLLDAGKLSVATLRPGTTREKRVLRFNKVPGQGNDA